MAQDIRALLQRYIQLEQALSIQLAQLRAQKNGIGTEIGKTIISKLSGAVVKDVFKSPSAGRYGGRIMKSVLSQQQRIQMQIQEKSISDHHDSNIQDVRGFLSTVSDKKPRIREPNSENLVKEIDKVQHAAKLETKINRSVRTLQSIATRNLAFNRDLPKLMGDEQIQRREAHIKPYDTLRQLEADLRNCISTKLESVSHNWWVERVPDDVRRKAEERKTKDDRPWPWFEQRDLHPIFYVDFTNYAKIIRRRDNWENVFKPIFSDEEIISAKLRELDPLRNAIAHNRELSLADVERLRILARDIISCLGTE